MSHFFHIVILEPDDKIFGVGRVDVKVLVVDYYCGHYCTRGLFTFSMRMRRTFSPNGSYYITRWKYEYDPWIL